MSTCFLFIKHLTDEGCLSLSLNTQGILDAPLAQRSFSEIQQLQATAKTIVVDSAEHFSFHQIELAWLPEKKARVAVPYALEEKLAEPVEELHFCFNKHYYEQGHYLIVVCKKNYLANILNKLDTYNIRIDFFTLDWFALAHNEACFLDHYLLVRDNSKFNGLLSLELAPVYLEQIPPDLTLYTFNNDTPPIMLPQSQLIDEEPLVWVAKRLKTHHPINLCQGQFTHDSTAKKVKKWYYAAAAMSLLWLISLITLNSIKIHSLNTQLSAVDAQIATIYRQFFPQAQQVLSPRFRIGQLLKGSTDTDNNFWLLLNSLTQALANNNSTIEQLRFQNQIMQVTVISQDFKALEGLQINLQRKRINVKQTQASSKDNQVIGVLELNL
ncbi:general secretion pathway protein L [Legionella beliardensis]|uniref:Type II secretion system protein L n=1 Tax=Legionella beliardensis TaxID=91822 RepID=A0A378I3T4_9GAMM|nr:type II secretion system protein GspL [Legionella beliardensis]STX29361.1 general secretion pathway protein L [Legionella beliardensis]